MADLLALQGTGYSRGGPRSQAGEDSFQGVHWKAAGRRVVVCMCVLDPWC